MPRGLRSFRLYSTVCKQWGVAIWDASQRVGRIRRYPPRPERIARMAAK